MNLAHLAGPRNLSYQTITFEIIAHRPRRGTKAIKEITSGFDIGDKGHAAYRGDIFISETNKVTTCLSSDLVLKIHTQTEEENEMSKKVGSFTNPNTGEEDWLEPSTISIVIVQPKMVTRVGETNQSAIDFKLDCTTDEEHITLVAEYTVSGVKYSSAPVLMPVEEFAIDFANLIYADRALDEADLIKEAKDQASQDLTRRLLDNNILMGGMQFSGFGFVNVGGDKVMSIDIVEFEYAIQSGQPVKSAMIRNCVSQASLLNLENPQIEFFTGTHKVVLVNPVVKQEGTLEGRIKTYALSIDDIVVTVDASMPDHKVYEACDFDNESFLDAFVEERKSLLDDIVGDDSDLDDQLAGLF